ncbi:hypothetical protein COC96_23145 [Bacillus cereus]|nr:hypothetical protein COC96_23145 [Bacillus cereus]
MKIFREIQETKKLMQE